jgi:hypothetical protein
MEAAHQDLDPLGGPRSDNPVNESVLSGDPPGPPATQIAPQWFRLADTSVSASVNIGY